MLHRLFCWNHMSQSQLFQLKSQILRNRQNFRQNLMKNKLLLDCRANLSLQFIRFLDFFLELFSHLNSCFKYYMLFSYFLQGVLLFASILVWRMQPLITFLVSVVWVVIGRLCCSTIHALSALMNRESLFLHGNDPYCYFCLSFVVEPQIDEPLHL